MARRKKDGNTAEGNNRSYAPSPPSPISSDRLLRAIRVMADLPGLMFGAGGGDRDAGIETGIYAALTRVGEFLNVSRAYVMLDEEDGRFLRNTHEWVSTNVGPAMSSWPFHEYKRDLPSLKPMMKGKTHFAAHIRDLPPDLQQTLGKQAIDSILLAPLLRDGEWIGLVGFDSCGTERQWREEDIDMLRHLAGLIAPAMERLEFLAIRRRLEQVRTVLGKTELLPASPAGETAGAKDNPTLIDAERQLIIETLARHHGNRGAAAKQLGIAWAALDRRCKKLGIAVQRT